MKQVFYLLFFNKLRNEAISLFLARLGYGVYCLRYFALRLLGRKRIVPENLAASRALLQSVSPKPVCRYDTAMQEADPQLDLSVIVPVYNYESVLDKMIRSILDQQTTYRYELILVDDGSREPAKQILRSYEQDPKVRLIFQQNMGISGARNTGISNARGQYLMFVDCDDTIHSNTVQRLLDEAYRTDADIVIGAHALVKEKDGVEYSRRDDIYPVADLEGYRDGDRIMNYPGFPWAKIYKREVFRQVRFPVNYWYEDTVVHFLLFRLAKRYAYVPEVFYDYRWYEGNYTKVQHKSNSRVLEHYWIVEHMLEESRRIGLPSDAMEYKVVLRHLGGYLYSAIRDLPEETKMAVFDLACELARQHRRPTAAMNLQLRSLDKCFRTRDYHHWVLICTKL